MVAAILSPIITIFVATLLGGWMNAPSNNKAEIDKIKTEEIAPLKAKNDVQDVKIINLENNAERVYQAVIRIEEKIDGLRASN